jgi:hypothetical protein
MQFEQLGSDGAARRGRLQFPRGCVETPAFMPVGTYGTVKGMLPRDIRATGAEILLGNTFHLWLRPGTDIIEQHGDLHDFMGWNGPILTDSGGFQVFSLGAMRKITEAGVAFRCGVNDTRNIPCYELGCSIRLSGVQPFRGPIRTKCQSSDARAFFSFGLLRHHPHTVQFAARRPVVDRDHPLAGLHGVDTYNCI